MCGLLLLAGVGIYGVVVLSETSADLRTHSRVTARSQRPKAVVLHDLALGEERELLKVRTLIF